MAILGAGCKRGVQTETVTQPTYANAVQVEDDKTVTVREETTKQPAKAPATSQGSTAPAAAKPGKLTPRPSKGDARTYTGLAPLEKVAFTAQDAQNTRGLGTTKVAHSYGVAKNGQAHSISVGYQAYFANGKFSAFTLDTKTPQKVLYLTFDCGYENGYTAKVLDTLQQKQVPAAFFSTLAHIKNQPELIARMINEGHIVGNHSATHPDFTTIGRTQMAQELEQVETYLRERFGYSAKYFRFPEGSYNESALELVGSLGLVSVFWSCAWADWDVKNPKGAQHAYDTVTARLHPGAVILLHAVSPDNAGALADIIDYAHAEGYVFCSLEQFPL